jgi:hypothetical protein
MAGDTHTITVFDGNAMFQEFVRDIAVRLDRLEAAGQMPEAVCLRADLWPLIGNDWNGYPLIRIDPSSPRMWGVLA